MFKTINDVIVNSLAGSQGLLQRYCEDLTPQEYLHRPTPKANCTAWLLGHLVLTERRALAALGVNLPDLPAGFEKQFSRDEGCPEAKGFGDTSILLPMFAGHRKLLIDRVKVATADDLNKPLEKPHPRFANLGEMINFMALHVTMHAGQITIIRRSLGRAPLN